MMYNIRIFRGKGRLMGKKSVFLAVFFGTVLLFALTAGERTIPVDMILMIDKSLSMEDPGKFDSLKRWTLDELIGQMLTDGDWVSVYQFYEKPEHLLSVDIKDQSDRQKIAAAVAGIQPNGKYTDIGTALDAINTAVKKRGSNGRHKILLIITDLEQDAPHTSRYAGKQARFKSPYLAEARIIKHDNWYEITLDMDIQDRVVDTTKRLYADILDNEGKKRTKADEKEALIKQNTP